MEHSAHDPATKGRSAWNAGRKLGAKRALKPQQVWAIRGYRQAEDQRSCRRRSCPQPGHRHSAKDRPASAVRASRACSHQHPGMAGGLGGTLDDDAFPSRLDGITHISTRQYARLVDEWVAGIGLRSEDYGTHSLRRTKASLIDKRTGNLRAVQILPGHAKIESRSGTSVSMSRML